MNRIDLTNLGGFPLEQDTLKFLQDSYTAAFAGLAALCGNKTILSGVVSNGTNVTPGWISYNGELIPFIGGALGAEVVISETSDSVTFQDGNDYPVYFTKTATCGAVGDFAFADLVPLLSLKNIWRPGDIKERYCDGAYITANFDAGGYGLNEEAGWRILTAAYPDAAGKVMVNIDPADAFLNTCGQYGGEKEHALSIQEIPSHSHSITASNQSNFGGSGYVPGVNLAGTEPGGNTNNNGGGQAHNNMPPYFVILKLLKL